MIWVFSFYLLIVTNIFFCKGLVCAMKPYLVCLSLLQQDLDREDEQVTVYLFNSLWQGGKWRISFLIDQF